MKVNDIYKWRYTDKACPSFEPYWCCSRIAIVRERSDGGLYLRDTYWSSVSGGRSFGAEDIGTKIEVTFLANFDDLISCSEGEACYYESKDIVDINHPNSSRGNIYIRKGAVKSLEKMKRITQAHIEYYERKAIRDADEAKRLKEHLVTLTVDSWIPLDKEVWWDD